MEGMEAMMAMMATVMGGMGGKGSKAANMIGKGEKVHHGILHCYNTERNAGRIYCKEIFEEYGQDVYAFKSFLDECGAGVGDHIAFFLHLNSKGQPQGGSPPLRLSTSVENNLALTGKFKNKNEEKGHGFIECWETHEYFGRDVYVPANLCENLENGTVVAFNCILNREGMPNCRMICECEEGYKPEPGDLSQTSAMTEYGKGGKPVGYKGMMSTLVQLGKSGIDPNVAMAMVGMGKGKGKGKGNAKGKIIVGMGPYGGMGKKPTPTGQYMTGTVKSYNPGNNYGFISSPDAQEQYGGADVFSGGTWLSKYQIGDAVQFQLALNEQGKPQAIDIEPLS